MKPWAALTGLTTFALQRELISILGSSRNFGKERELPSRELAARTARSSGPFDVAHRHRTHDGESRLET